MSTSGAAHRTYKFGKFTLDVDRGALRCGIADIKLRPKSFQMLSYLVERHGTLVSKDELLDAIWTNTVVTDDAVTQCLIDIRRAINDSNQAKIRTIPRRGYIFDEPVQVRDELHIRLSGLKKPMLGAALLTVILAGSAALWWVEKSGDSPDKAISSEATVVMPSIAVLPFADMSMDQDQEYFADGISEEVLNLLTEIPDLRVIARTSSFSFKGKDADIAEIAERLNVTHIVEGSVRIFGNRLRVTAQLVNGSTGEHLWSRTYDRILDDIFAIQDDISAAVVEQLKVSLFVPRPKARKTETEVYRLYLLATHLSNRLYPDEDAQAESLFRRALQLDPNFAPAWRELSRVLWRQIGTGHSVQNDIRHTRNALSRALEIEPDDAASLAYLARHVVTFDGDIVSAARLFEHAISIDPANEHVVRNAVMFASAFGRPDDAIALGEYGVARNPICELCLLQLARAYRDAGHLVAAETLLRKYVSLTDTGYAQLGVLLLLQGRSEAALAAFDKVRDEPARLGGSAMAMHDLGRLDESAAAFAAFLEATTNEHAWVVAKAYAWTRQVDSAFSIIDRAAEHSQYGDQNGDIWPDLLDNALNLKHPLLYRLRDDPRWQSVVERYGVPNEQLAAIGFSVTLPE